MRVQVGSTAPDFELGSHRGDTVRLSSFRGRKHVVIAFHPLAFTPVCGAQMRNYEADQTWFSEHDAHVLGLSVDSVPAKTEWAKTLNGITYDLLSDFHPHGGVAQAYGVQRDDGISERAVFVVDKAGQVVFAKVYDIPTLPDNIEVRQAIEAIYLT
jgi:peroxiredoxin (alkyl hydroperoxide reductase subunit C)